MKTKLVRLFPDRKHPYDYEAEVIRPVVIGGTHAQAFLVRAITPEGAVLMQNTLSSSMNDGFEGYRIETWNEVFIGNYEWQHLVDDDWVTVSRYWVPPREDQVAPS